MNTALVLVLRPLNYENGVLSSIQLTQPPKADPLHPGRKEGLPTEEGQRPLSVPLHTSFKLCRGCLEFNK